MNESSVVVFRASLCVSIASARRFWSVFGHLLLQLLRLLRPVPFLRCAWDMVQPSASFGVQRNLLARQCPPAHTSSSFPWSLLPCSLTDRFSSVSRRHRLGAPRQGLTAIITPKTRAHGERTRHGCVTELAGGHPSVSRGGVVPRRGLRSESCRRPLSSSAVSWYGGGSGERLRPRPWHWPQVAANGTDWC